MVTSSVILNPSVAECTDLPVGPRTSRTPAFRNFQRTSSPFVAGALIAAILIGGLPMLTGVVVIADSKPTLTLDVCHPIGGASYNLDLGQSEAPLIPARSTAQLLREWGTAPEFVAAFSPRVSEAPDPPPPKIGA
jgi:hypothetical protein